MSLLQILILIINQRLPGQIFSVEQILNPVQVGNRRLVSQKKKKEVFFNDSFSKNWTFCLFISHIPILRRHFFVIL